MSKSHIDMPTWDKASRDGVKNAPRFAPPAEELVAVTAELPPDDLPAAYSADDDLEGPEPSVHGDTHDPLADTPEDSDPVDIVPYESPDFAQPAQETIGRIVELQDNLRVPVAAFLEDTQADYGSLVAARIHQELRENEVNSGSTPPTPELNATPRSAAEEQLEKVKRDPSILYDLASETLRKEPAEGSIRRILKDIDPQKEFQLPQEENSPVQERRGDSTEELFEKLRLRTTVSEGYDQSEAHIALDARKRSLDAGKKEDDALYNNPLDTLWKGIKKVRNAPGNYAVQNSPDTMRKKENNEAIVLDNVSRAYFSHLAKNEPEHAIKVLEEHINNINDRHLSNQHKNNPEKPAYSLPHHEDRLLELYTHAHRLRTKYTNLRHADEALINDFGTLVEMAEREDEYDNSPYANDQSAIMAGKQEIYPASEKTIRRQATLALLKARFAYRDDPQQAINSLADSITAIYRVPINQRGAAWIAHHPDATIMGDAQRMTAEELQVNLELAGTLYNLALTIGGTPAANQTLGNHLQSIAEQLDGEAARDASDGIGSRQERDFTGVSPEDLRSLEERLIIQANQEALENHSNRGNPRTETMLKEVEKARIAREKDLDGRLGQRYSAYESAIAEIEYEARAPGEVCIIGGSADLEDGTHGPLTASIATHRPRQIDIIGDNHELLTTVHSLGETTVRNLGISFPTRPYSLIAVEGSAPPYVNPGILEQVKPNGTFILPAGPNLALAAQTAMNVDPEWYNDSILPSLMSQYKESLDLSWLEQQERQNPFGSTFRPEGYRCILLPSTVCRFNTTQNGIKVTMGHAKELHGRPPEWTLVVCRDPDNNGPSELFKKLSELPPYATA